MESQAVTHRQLQAVEGPVAIIFVELAQSSIRGLGLVSCAHLFHCTDVVDSHGSAESLGLCVTNSYGDDLVLDGRQHTGR